MRKKVIRMLGAFLALIMLFTMLSRAADSIGIPTVETSTIQNMVIAHKVTAQGKVVQNREQAVSTEPNQVVKAIYVNEGQQVEEGELLFELDMEELKEQILAVKQELQKQELQSADNKSSQETDAASKALTRKHAASNYTQTKAQGDRAVQKAKEELAASKKALKEYTEPDGDFGEDRVERILGKNLEEKEKEFQEAQKNREDLEKEIEKKVQEALGGRTDPDTQAPETNGKQEGTACDNLERQQMEAELRKQYQSAVETAEGKENIAKEERDAAAQALESYRQNRDTQAQSTSQISKEQLLQAVKEKQEAYDQAVIQWESDLQSAENALEDANVPEAQNSSADIAEIEREQKELTLEKLEKLEMMEGKVTSPVKGVVTKVVLTTGDRTPDGTAILLADLSSGNKFTAQIPSDQEKYVARKDEVSLKPENNKDKIEGLTIDSIRVNEEDKNMLDVTINLPTDLMEMGTTAEMEVMKKSETYKSCIPLSALHYDNKQAYVLVVEERETVLGTELASRRVDVTVEDKNDQYAALQEGVLTSDQKVISSSDKTVEPGGRIRLEK